MKKIIEIKEDVRIGDLILESGDRIKVLKETSNDRKVQATLAELMKSQDSIIFAKNLLVVVNSTMPDGWSVPFWREVQGKNN